MSEGSPDFRSSLRRILQTADGKGHPALDTLEAFHWGDLPADEADPVRAHISGCPDCLDLLAQLDEFGDAESAADVEIPEEELERSFGRVRERLRAEADLPAPQAARPRFFPGWSTAPGPYALVAASLAIGIGLALWLAGQLEMERQRLPELESRLAAATARTTAAEEKLEGVRQQALSLEQQAIALRRERDQLLAPQPNTPIVDLSVSGERGAGREVTEIRLAPGVRFVTLVLEEPGEQSRPSYRLEVLDQQGNRVIQVAGLRRTRYRNYVVTLPRALLRRGEYQLRLVGLEAGSGRPAAVYNLKIEDE